MGLQIPGQEDDGFQIFSHSKEFDQGGGKIRPGQATVVVALDGSGDAGNIQEGLDMLPNDGGNVFIKEGTYTITAAIKIKNNIALLGTGKGTIITTTGNITAIENYDHTSGNNGIVIKDLKINAASQDNVAERWAIHLKNADNCIISDVNIVDAGGKGIELELSDENIINSCIITNSFETSIVLDGSKNNTLFGNVCTAAVETQEGHIWLNLNPCNGNAITGNICDKGAFGIIIDVASDYNTMTSNVCRNGGDGIGIILGCSYNVISANIVEGNGDDGIDLNNGPTYNTVTGNICEGNGGTGIIEQNGATNFNCIVGNVSDNNTAADITILGANTVSANNVT